jgi:GT2 family glycosyltransferase
VIAPRVSVIICAFSTGRLSQTVACVDSVLRQQLSPDQVIVVVDHNADLERELGERLPADVVEVLANPGDRGLSSARNAGIRASRGQIVVFIDDDAAAEPSWLKNLLGAFADQSVLGAGGHARPKWDGRPPTWFPPELLWVVGCSYAGLPLRGPVRNPLGCNMAFRAETFDRAGLFDTRIGRLGGRPLGCEETEFCIRARRVVPGAQLVLVDNATIDHAVPQARARVSYLVRRCFYEGISKSVVRRLGDSETLDTERAYVRRALLGRLVACLRGLLRGPSRGAALGQAVATVAGVSAAALGYAYGGLTVRLPPLEARASSDVSSCSATVTDALADPLPAKAGDRLAPPRRRGGRS